MLGHLLLVHWATLTYIEGFLLEILQALRGEGWPWEGLTFVARTHWLLTILWAAPNKCREWTSFRTKSRGLSLRFFLTACHRTRLPIARSSMGGWSRPLLELIVETRYMLLAQWPSVFNRPWLALEHSGVLTRLPQRRIGKLRCVWIGVRISIISWVLCSLHD